MNAEHSFNSDDAGATLETDQARRDRLMEALPLYFTVVHLLTGLAIITGSYYYFPSLKHQLEQTKATSSTLAIDIIARIDMLTNYWYVLVIPLYFTVKANLATMRWIAHEIGLREVTVYAGFVVLVLLTPPTFAQYVLLFF